MELLFLASEVAPLSKTGRAGRRGGRAAGGAGRAAATRWRWSRRATASSTRPGTASTPRDRARAGARASRPPSACADAGAAHPLPGGARALLRLAAAASTPSTATSTATTPSASPTSAAPRWRCRPPSATARASSTSTTGRPALAAWLLRHEHAGDPALARTRSVFTIHNLAYQGVFPKELLPALGLPWERLPPRRHGVPRPAQPDEGRAGLRRRHHHRLAHLRPRDRHGRRAARGWTGCCGHRAGELYRHPQRHRPPRVGPGRATPTCRPTSTRQRLAGKRGLQAGPAGGAGAAGAPRRAAAWRVVGRLADQKGIDLLLAALPELLRRDLQLALLGSGRRDWEEAFAAGGAPARATGWRSASASTRGWPTASRPAPTSSSCRAASSPAA